MLNPRLWARLSAKLWTRTFDQTTRHQALGHVNVGLGTRRFVKYSSWEGWKIGGAIRGTAAQGTETNFDEFWAAAGQSYPPEWPLHPLKPSQNEAKNMPKWAKTILACFWLLFGVVLEGGGAIWEGNLGWRKPKIRQNYSLSPGPLSP